MGLVTATPNRAGSSNANAYASAGSTRRLQGGQRTVRPSRLALPFPPAGGTCFSVEVGSRQPQPCGMPQAAAPRRTDRHRVVFRAAGSAGPDSSGDARPLEAVCRDLTRHFLEACVSQLGVPYNSAMTSFVQAAKEAYVGGASVAAVSLQWQMSGGTGWDMLDTFLEQKGGLQADEVELRSSWLSTCFLTFSEANLLREEAPAAGDAGVDDARLGTFVQNVTEMAKRGSDVQRVKLQEVLAMSEGSGEPRSELESAALSQGIRLVFLSLEACGALTHDGQPVFAAGRQVPEDEDTPEGPLEPSRAQSDEGETKQSKDQSDSDAARSARFKARIEAERKEAASKASTETKTETKTAKGARAAVPEKEPQQSDQLEKDSKEPNQPASEEDIRASLSKLRARELKAQLESRSVGTSDCFDKDGLLDKLTGVLLAEQNGSAARSSNPSSGAISVPIKWSQAASLFAGVSSQQGEYAGIDLDVKAGTQSFVIDTAASVNILTPERAQLIQAQRTGVTASGQGGTGALGNSYEVSLGEACMGGVDLRGSDFRAVVMPAPVSPGYAGIIGLSFLNAFDAVQFRWGQRPGEVLFHPRGSSAPWATLAEGLTTFDLEIITSGLPCVSVSVGGRPPIRALVDTGAAFSVVNSAAGIATDPSVQDMVVTGLDGRPQPLGVSAGDEEIRIGSVSVGSGRLLVGDLPAFAMLAGAAAQPALILGLDILSQRPQLLFSATQRKMAL